MVWPPRRFQECTRAKTLTTACRQSICSNGVRMPARTGGVEMQRRPVVIGHSRVLAAFPLCRAYVSGNARSLRAGWPSSAATATTPGRRTLAQTRSAAERTPAKPSLACPLDGPGTGLPARWSARGTQMLPPGTARSSSGTAHSTDRSQTVVLANQPCLLKLVVESNSHRQNILGRKGSGFTGYGGR